MQIHVTTNLILTVPLGKEKDLPSKIMIEAEQYINNIAAVFEMPETKTKVGIRIHIQSDADYK